MGSHPGAPERTLGEVPPTSADHLRATARELAPLTRVWTALLDRHVPDDGGLCVACTRSTGVRPRWPCRLAEVADLARRAAVHQDGSERRPTHA